MRSDAQVRGCVSLGWLSRAGLLVGRAFVRLDGRGQSLRRRDGLTRGEPRGTAASLLLRPHAPPPGPPATWDRTWAQKGGAARVHTPDAVGPRPLPHGG